MFQLLLAIGALGLSLSAVAAEPTLNELLNAADNAARGDSSTAVMRMHVKTARYERTMTMQISAMGTEKTLIRILEPAKEAGVSTLKVNDKIWNYLPKIDRTLKVPSGMMGGSWMGSHFTNDDLVKESRFSDDYVATLNARPQNTTEKYQISLVPKPNAPVVWGRVDLTVNANTTPDSIAYFDEKGTLIRTMRFSDFQNIDGTLTPMRFTLQPANKPAEFTEVIYDELKYNVVFPPHTFTLQALRR